MIGTATLRQLVELGLDARQILAVAEAMEIDARPKDATAAERMRRHRANKANGADATRNGVTRNVTANTPPNDNNLTPPVPIAEAIGADAEVEISPETAMWNIGKAFLMRHGVPKSRAGTALGKWKRQQGVAATVEALGVAEQESRMTGGLVDPIAFIEGVFRHREPAMEAPLC
jgi:hypothetical protein